MSLVNAVLAKTKLFQHSMRLCADIVVENLDLSTAVALWCAPRMLRSVSLRRSRTASLSQRCAVADEHRAACRMLRVIWF
eukprot:6182607-Pleurochrysis_carterae.AAC.2